MDGADTRRSIRGVSVGGEQQCHCGKSAAESLLCSIVRRFLLRCQSSHIIKRHRFGNPWRQRFPDGFDPTIFPEHQMQKGFQIILAGILEILHQQRIITHIPHFAGHDLSQGLGHILHLFHGLHGRSGAGTLALHTLGSKLSKPQIGSGGCAIGKNLSFAVGERTFHRLDDARGRTHQIHQHAVRRSNVRRHLLHFLRCILLHCVVQLDFCQTGIFSLIQFMQPCQVLNSWCTNCYKSEFHLPNHRLCVKNGRAVF